MAENTYINLDCSPERFSALTSEIATAIKGAEDVQELSALNVFKDRRDAGSELYNADTLKRYESRLRAAKADLLDAVPDVVRVVECASDADKRPVDLTLLSGLVSLIAEVFSDEVPCEMLTLRYAESQESRFATSIEITSISHSFSDEAMVQDISAISETLQANDLMIDIAAVKAAFPDMVDDFEAAQSALQREYGMGGLQ